MRTIVIGCGVSGLTSAVRLLEAGHDVVIRARKLPPHTTSNVAAAFWHPYRAAEADPVRRWAGESFRCFSEMAASGEGGVAMHPVLQVFRERQPDPWWRDFIPGFRHARAEELEPPYTFAFAFDAPVIDTSRFLPYLIERVGEFGASIETGEVASLDAAAAEVDAIVNCTGMGARELTGDPDLVPVRGEIVRTENPGVEHVLVDELHPGGVTYVIPRLDDCVLGGSYQKNDEDLTPDPALQAGIRERCESLEPRLVGAPTTSWATGLRPARERVRLETETLPSGKPVVHNYGHGGAGVTLSWGCALDVAERVSALQAT